MADIVIIVMYLFHKSRRYLDTSSVYQLFKEDPVMCSYLIKWNFRFLTQINSANQKTS
jgi:hypothetical protein